MRLPRRPGPAPTAGSGGWPKTAGATGTAHGQGAAARTWLAEREADLSPVGYFHVMFTLPAEVADIAYQNKAARYGPLFQAV